MERINKHLQLVAAAGSLFLAACSGGEESATDMITERVTEEVSNVVEVLGSADDCYQRDMLIDDLITAVNAARSEAQVCQGVPFPAVSPLTNNLRLQNAAVNHSDDMAVFNFFSHTGSNGLTGGGRADVQGYLWTVVGENLAAGYSDPEEVVEAWLASDQGHCENLMNPQMLEMGGACKTGGVLNLFENYWTLLLGSTQ